MTEKVGEIYYEIDADVAGLIESAKQVNSSFNDLSRAADGASGRLNKLDQASRSASKSTVRVANDSSQAAKTTEALGNEIAILEERERKGARAATILAAELRAGAGATAAQKKEIAALTGQLYDMRQAQSDATSAQQKATGTAGVLKTSFTAIASAIAVSQLVQYGKQFLEVADAMTQLQARIDRLSPSAKEGQATFQALAMIASQSGASLQETAKLWEQLTTSLKTAGATNGQIIALTDTLQKIGRIGGSSADEMSNALRQFGQSIASGTIRAEEFNSILEQMPELARQIASGLGVSVGELRKRMLEGKLTAEDALNAIMSRTSAVNSEFEKLPRTTGQATNSLSIAFQELVKQVNDATGASMTMVKVVDSLTSAIDRLTGQAQTASQQMADLTSTGEMYARRARTWSAIGLDGWAEQAEGVSALSNRAAALVGDLNAVTQASKKAADNQPIKISGSGGDDKAVKKLEASTKRKLELSKLEGESRARLQAQYDAEDAGIKDSARIKSLQDEYAATERNTTARKASTAEGKKSASQAESISQKLANLKQQSELAASSTQQLSREQALLRAEQSLGKGATSEQINQARDYAAAVWDTAAAIKARNAIPELKENADYSAQKSQLEILKSTKDAQGNLIISQQQYNATSEQLEQEHQTKLAQIRANQSVTPQQQAAGAVDPVQALANENAQKLALIQQFESQKVLTEQQSLALRNAANTQYEQQRTAAMWTLFSQQNAGNAALAETFESLQGNASNALTGIVTGSMGAQEAMSSLTSNALNSLINSFVQMGAEWVKSSVMGAAAQTTAITTTTAASVAGTATTTAASTAAAGTTMAAWLPAALVASIGSFGAAAVVGGGALLAAFGLIAGLSGKRKNGGPVSAGSMYQVGEGGMPEIYQASSGKQYMIPGDNGSVISNKDMTSSAGGSGGVVINIQNYTSATVDAQANNTGGGLTIDVIVADLNQGGPIRQAITRNTTASARATE
ncbi:tape measure protein [Pantoea agglomerans]|jgi:tape measure domain-containing protein|uniref:tape measure protein n=1 Tax=Enterobacter agglomerans TaxID=549 RepID=UPI0019BA7087|nr:tape measure protein [Pantoea agglomerans]SMQ21014.1 tape measure domain-containing protein [Pantoea agglomerans]